MIKMMDLKKTIAVLTLLMMGHLTISVAQTNVLYVYGDVDVNGWKKFESNYNGTPYHQMRLNNAGQTSSGDNAGTGLSSFKSAIESLPGFTITEAYDQSITLNAAYLSNYDIIIFGSNQKTWSVAERDAVDVWVRAGGALLVYSDSGFGGKYSNPSPAGINNEQGRDSDNLLTEQFGMRFYIDQGGSSGNNVVTSYTIPHPINNNQLNSSASDFIKVEGEGCSPVRIDPNFSAKVVGDVVYQIAKHQFNGTTASVNNDPDLPNGTDAALNCALAAAEIGNGRVIGYFDRNTFWNSGPGTNINKAGFKHVDFIKNVMTWLEGASAPTPVAGEVRVNTGGSGYISFTGDNFVADTYYTGGTVSTTTATISNTSDQSLYQSERWGNMNYDIPVVNDTFDINLHFAEIFTGVTGPGQRVFHVDIEGARVLNSYDIYADAGFRTAVVKTYQVIITDGQIDIDFTNVVDNAKISAIEIMPSSNSSTPAVGVTVSGEFRKWHNITLTMEGGPNFCESSTPNPFRDFRLDVTFTNGTASYTVPGYFAADGNAANTGASCGDKWRAHFSPDRTGTWNYTVSFREGTDVAIDNNPMAGSAGVYDLLAGSFVVQATNKSAPDIRAKGLLQYTGGRYLQWAETGEFFIKGGTDSPENFLGYYEFDNTSDNGGAANDLTGAPHNDGLHHYDAHLNDWNSGDAQWKGSQGRRIVGAVNYLASEGINSFYFITMNVNGDGREVYPWTTYNERNRFDISKLAQWEIVFSHMEKKGIAMHVLTQETENDQLLNGGDLGAERKLYYRELVARFGHHNAINWNLGEEISNSTQQIKDFATFIKGIDPYDHFVSVHTYPGQQQTVYNPLLGYPDIDGVSLQVDLNGMPNETRTWITNSGNASRQWVVNGDEVGPYYDGVKPDGAGNNHTQVRSKLVWGNIMNGGGGSELYFGYNHAHNDLDCEDFRSRNSMWDFVRHATRFAEDHIPLDEVSNYTNLSNSSNNYVLAKKGDKYFIYIDDANGSTTINLESHVGPFDLQWFDPRIGGSLQYGSVTTITGPGTRNLGTPPGGSTTNDWVAILTNHNVGFISSIIPNGVTCYNGSNGSATAYGLNGASPLSYQWSNGATTQTVSNLSPGGYSVTITDANSNTSSASTTITEPVQITVSENVVDESCTGNDGSIVVSSVGGNGSYTYLWSTGTTGATLGNLTTGNYTVTATDVTGCSVQKMIYVDFNQTSANINLNDVNTSETCLGNDGAINISPSGGNAPYTFVWSNGATTEDISGLAAGNYTVTITDQGGCADIDMVTLAFNAANANFNVDSSITAAGCAGGDGAIALNVSGGTGPYTYSWSGGSGPLGGCDEFSEQNGMVHVEFESITAIPSWTTQTSVGGYTNSSYLEWKTGNTSTSVDPAGSSTMTYFVHITTTGRYRFLIRSAAPAPTDYNDVWARFPDNGALAIKTGSTQNLGTGWFKIYQNTSGNNWTWNTSTVDNNPHEIFADFNTPGTYRVEVSGRSTQFKVDRFTLFHSSVAYGTATNTNVGQSPFGVCTEDSIGGLNPGVYSVQITDANGCSSIETYTVPLDPNTVPYNVTANVVNQSCAGNDGAINVTINNGGSSGPFTYVWSNGATTEDLNSLAAGTYTVTVQDNSGCESVATYTIAVNAGSGNFQTSEVVTDETCNPGNNGAISLVVNQGNGTYTYQWSTGTTTNNVSNLSAGNYTVTITDQNGCVDIENYSIATIPGQGVFGITNTNTNQNCQSSNGTIDITVTGGSPSYMYQWSNGSTVQDITSLNAGTYTVTITDQKGCYAIKNFAVGVTPGPANHVLSGSSVNESCFGNDGSATVTVGSSGGPFTFLWSNGKTTQTITNITSGAYSVTVTDAGGCFDNISATVNLQPGEYDFGMNSLITEEGCVGANGAIDLSLSNGTPNLTFQWSNGATTEDLTAIGAGTYTITVTDISGCYMDSVFVVGFDTTTSNYSLSENVTGETCNLSDASIDLTVGGGIPPYVYTWSNGATTEDISNVAAGNYNVVILDSNNCMTTRSFTIPFIPGPISLNVFENIVDETCTIGADGTIDITSVTGGTGTYSYLWSTGATTAMASSLSSGVHTVVISDQNGCYQSSSYSIAISPGPASFATADSVQNEGCKRLDGYIDITPAGGTAPYTFNWSNGQTSEDLSALQAGTYTVTLTDNNGCFDTEVYTIAFDSTNGNFNLAQVVTGESCSLNDASINLNVSGGTAPYTYSWNTGATTDDLNNVTAGTYAVSIVDSANCVTNKTFNIPFVSGAVTLNVTDSLVHESCMTGTDGTIDVSSVSGGVPGYSYLWSTGATANTVSNLSAGSYTLTITDQVGCYHTTMYNVSLNPGPALFPTADTIGSEGCSTLDGFIDITPAGGNGVYSFLWSNGSTLEDISNISAGAYTVVITDGNGCYDTENYFVNFDASDGNFNFAEVVNDAGCSNNDGAIDITVTGGNGGYSYLWSNGASTEDLNNVPGGTYSVVATDQLGCTSTRAYIINTIVGAANFAATQTIVKETCTVGGNGAIDVTIGAGGVFSYLWSNGATTQDIQNLISGAYSLTVSNDIGCYQNLNYNVQIVAGITNYTTNPIVSNESCSGNDGSIVVAPSGGSTPYSYSWSSSSTTATAANLNAGTYFLVITDSRGCYDNETYTVGFTGGPKWFNVSRTLNNTSCSGNDGGVNITVNTGVGPFTFLWSDGSTNEDLQNVAAGTYSVTITDFRGCFDTKTYVIGQNGGQGSFTVGNNLTNPGCANNNGAINQTLAAGNGPYTFVWSTGATTEDLNGLSAGTYSVTVTDKFGCYVDQIYTLAITGGSATFNVVDNTSNETCAGNNGSINISVAGGVSPYSYVWSDGSTTQDISNVPAGTYTVTISDNVGCVDTRVFNVNFAPGQSSAINITGNIVSATCALNNGVISPNVTGGNGPYTYVWSSGTTAQNASGLNPGLYTVTITDLNGCFNIRTFTVGIDTTAAANYQINSTIVDESCLLGDGSIILNTIGGGSGNYGFMWSTGSTGQNISGLTAGTYTLTVNDQNGCSGENTFQVGFNSANANFLVLDSTVNEACGQDDGYIGLNISGGSGFYSYLWSNGVTTSYASGLTSGTYNVTIADTNGCAMQQSFTVINLPGPGQPVISQIQDTLIASMAATYQWFFNGNQLSGAVGQTHAYTQSGYYYVQITDLRGCTSVSDSVMVTVIGISDNGNGAVVQVYPNPFHDHIDISFVSVSGRSATIRVENLLGQLMYLNVLEGNLLNQNHRIDLNALRAGMYLLSIETEKERLVKRIIKE